MLGSHVRWRRRRRRGSAGVRSPASAPARVAARPVAEHQGMAEDELSATDLLLRASAGQTDAVDGMFPVIYDELRRLAHRHLSGELNGRTLGTTELVHEAYLRLVDQTRVQWNDRAHFLGVAAIAMRRILVDRARSRKSVKIGRA